MGNIKLKETKVLGVKINKVNMEESVDTIFKFFEEPGLHIVHTTNPEFILTAQDDKEYKEILNGAALAVPDGIGVVLASKFKKVKLKDRVSGCDLAQILMDKMQGTDYSVYIIGCKQERLDKALANLKDRFPNLKIAGSHNGYFGDDDDEDIIKDINDSGATLLLVGLGGIPKQEKWVWKYKDRLNVKVTIGVGGTIDVISGDVKRAPVIYQKLCLEWLYRTLSEPKKRIPRVYRLPYFVWLSFLETLGRKNKK